MISVDEARARILASVRPVSAETVSLEAAFGRVTAAPVMARLSQPPADVSGMDGYAVRFADLGEDAPDLTQAGTVAPGGEPHSEPLQPGEAVRVYTGSLMPAGADTVVIREDVDVLSPMEAESGLGTVLTGVFPGRRLRLHKVTHKGCNVRTAGMDFAAGDTVVAAGRCLTARDITLAAAAGHPWLAVSRRPRVAILATGNELVLPGEVPQPGQIMNANTFALAALVQACGGEPVFLGIAPDDATSLSTLLAQGVRGADLLLTSGGASVGDLDLIRPALAAHGTSLDFWKVAVRPGKPMLFGRLGAVPVLGLPGNPVSALVCLLLFLRPALRRMQSLTPEMDPFRRARLAEPVAANDERETYLRATLERDPSDDALVVTPCQRQDSALLTVLATAQGLLRRPANAAAAAAGDMVEVLPFPAGMVSV